MSRAAALIALRMRTIKIVDDGETIRVPVHAEDVDVRKEARVVEEVEISKRPVTENRRVSETVRREEIDVDETKR